MYMPAMSIFQPDSSLVAEVVPSPNHDERKDGRAPDIILLHYTGMQNAQEALNRLCSPESKVSSHYFVFEDGRIVQSVQESRRAWHAGDSQWAGETDINSSSIGIEIANPGHDFGYPDFPTRQIAAVIALCRGIIARRGIKPERVLAHSDVAPSRKRDPGRKISLAAAGRFRRRRMGDALAHHRQGVRVLRSARKATGCAGCKSLWPILAMAFRLPANLMKPRATWSPPSSGISGLRKIDGIADGSTHAHAAEDAGTPSLVNQPVV